MGDMRNIGHRPAALGALVCVAACSLPPHVVVKLEDPGGDAASATALFLGTDVAELARVELDGELSFPTQITVSAPDTGTVELFVEARAGDEVLARGRAPVRFKRRGTPTAVVVLDRACAADVECQDDAFCDGTGYCTDGVCVYEAQPCGSSFECVRSTCNEAEDRCEVTVDHSVCNDGLPLGEWTRYCNTVVGCVEGDPCLDASDCDDGDVCNGVETCENFHCVPGAPPSIDDGDPCTIDGCDSRRLDDGLDAVFHIGDQATDGAPCELPSGNQGVCRYDMGGCWEPRCGDGIVQSALGEICDDGASNSNVWAAEPHCGTTCTSYAPHCGDGEVAAGHEECDDGAGNFNGWRVDAHCTTSCSALAPHCGDDVLDAGFEACDDGAANSNDWSTVAHCNSTCTGLAAHCGDGTVQGQELCDDGAANSDAWSESSRCNTACDGLTSHCGDGDTDAPYEACDDGADNFDGWRASPHCNSSCSAPGPHCGDGAIDAGFEICDDAADNGDGWSAEGHCNASCTGRAPRCGDGEIEAGFEECDSGPDNGDDWSLVCHCNLDCSAMAPCCGDSVLDDGETCDDGDSFDNGNGCDATCQRNDVCGDGQHQAWFEDCDDGPGDSETCDYAGGGEQACTAAECGDDYVNSTAGEECDDGGTASGDGCGPSCLWEVVFGATVTIAAAGSTTLGAHQLTTDGSGAWLVAWHVNGTAVDDAMISRSLDIGATWTAPTELVASDTGYDYMPDIAVDDSGHWVAVWHSTEDLGGTIGTDNDIFVARSSDAGLSWSAAAVLNTNADSDSSVLDYDPRIATDDSGNWVVVWRSQDFSGGPTGSDSDVLVASSSDAGVSWSAPASLNSNAETDSGGDYQPRVDVDDSGTWVTVWYSSDDLGGTVGSDSDLLFATSTDVGVTWSTPSALNTNAASDAGDDEMPEIGTDGSNWVVVWSSTDDLGGTVGVDGDILVARSTDGVNWTAPSLLSAPNDGGLDADPDVTTDSAGNWFVVWSSDDDLMGGVDDDDVYLARSHDAGATWSAPVPVNPFSTSDAFEDSRPEIATDGLGNWVVVWSRDESLVATSAVFY